LIAIAARRLDMSDILQASATPQLLWITPHLFGNQEDGHAKWKRYSWYKQSFAGEDRFEQCIDQTRRLADIAAVTVAQRIVHKANGHNHGEQKGIETGRILTLCPDLDTMSTS
jgi:hypothetical protein